MYERFTDRSRKVMQLANQEALRFNHEYIAPEHILLGLIKEGSGVGANILKNLDQDLRKIRLELEKLMDSGADMIIMGRLPQTPYCKMVIEFAMDEARRCNNNFVGTEHLLLGLLRIEDHKLPVVQLFKSMGITLEAAREERIELTFDPEDSSSAKEYFIRELDQALRICLSAFGLNSTTIDTLAERCARNHTIAQALLSLLAASIAVPSTSQWPQLKDHGDVQPILGNACYLYAEQLPTLAKYNRRKLVDELRTHAPSADWFSVVNVFVAMMIK